MRHPSPLATLVALSLSVSLGCGGSVAASADEDTGGTGTDTGGSGDGTSGDGSGGSDTSGGGESGRRGARRQPLFQGFEPDRG